MGSQHGAVPVGISEVVAVPTSSSLNGGPSTYEPLLSRDEEAGQRDTSSSLQKPEQPGHEHFSDRAPWLRAAILGANDGLVSISSMMAGVGAVSSDNTAMLVSGLAGLVAGALSMAIGEYLSVFGQKDTEEADIAKERLEHSKGPRSRARELDELTLIYEQRGLPYALARQVAVELSKGDVVRVHARDELGIDMDDLSNPLQAALVSALAFSCGGIIPLLAAGFVKSYNLRLVALSVSSTLALLVFGALGAHLGGAPRGNAALRVMIGGWMAMLITFGVLKLFGSAGL